MTEVPNRSEIWLFDWGTKCGAEGKKDFNPDLCTLIKTKEFTKKHFSVCLSADNESSDVALFCPLTTYKGPKDNQGDYAVLLPDEFTGKKCWALLKHIRCVDLSITHIFSMTLKGVRLPRHQIEPGVIQIDD
jgi:hypothetical protein